MHAVIRGWVGGGGGGEEISRSVVGGLGSSPCALT